MKKRFTEEQIIGFLKQADAGMAIKELCHSMGFPRPAFTCGGARTTGDGWFPPCTSQCVGDWFIQSSDPIGFYRFLVTTNCCRFNDSIFAEEHI